MNDERNAPLVEANLDARIAKLAPGKRALLLERLSRHSAETSIPRVRRNGFEDSGFELSFAQQRLWFLEQWESGGALYNVAQGWWLEGPLDVQRLQDAFAGIVSRHESLRTALVSVHGEPRQKVMNEAPVELEVVDLRGLRAQRARAEALELARALARQGFDLAQPPLLRVALYRVGEHAHLLALVIHHIVSDGWSMGVLLRELSTFYATLSRVGSPVLADLPIQYVDYAVWQRDLLAGETLGRQLEYWTRQLAGTPLLRLPTDGSHPVARSLRGARTHLRLSVALTDALKRMSEREGVTLFMTLLAALQVLLSRHTGQTDIPVGTPIAGRTRREIEGLIGFFANTLVLRTDTSGNPGFLTLLHRVRDVCLGAYANQDLPFEKLVEVLKPARDLNHHPLFDVMLNLFERPENALQLDGLTGRKIALDTGHAKFAMTLKIDIQEDGAGMELEYQDALFSAERMTHLLAQYHHLLEQIVAAPVKPILDYSLITPAMRARLPDPSAAIDAPQQELVVEQFAGWVERQPEAIAVSQAGRVWSYGALADAAHRVAQALVQGGIGQGDVVAIVGPRSLGLVSSMLGVWLGGGVILTIDDELPEARQRVMMREARVKAICAVGSSPLPEWMSETFARVFEVDPVHGIGDAFCADSRVAPAPLPAIEASAPAYIFFTSGSTGVPKGILGCHKGLSHFLGWQREAFGIGPQDRVAQLASLSFDVLLRDVFLPLTNGGTLCIPGDADRIAPLPWLERERVTVVHTVPTLLQTWLAQASTCGDLLALRWLFVSGEPLSGNLIRAWRAAFPGSAEMVNLYGPTETTLTKCFHRIGSEVEPGLQPVGVAMPQAQALVLNEAGTPCGVGETGQVVLRTPFGTLGYINATQEMRTRFVRNPYRADADDLLYYTGDRGRYRVDGALDLCGRLDDQVKVRGVRVEPAEVTAVLGGHPAVKACIVVGRKDGRGDDFLAAYVVVASSKPVAAHELRAFLDARLPAALVPSVWQFLDVLPRLPNGKVDRSALPEPTLAWTRRAAEDAAPRNAVESQLIEIWQEVLRLSEIGVNDSFFDVGGHSLKAMQLLSRIHEALGVELSLRRLFETPTVADLAKEIAKISREAEEAALQRILDEVGVLSDEEVERELDEEAGDA